MHGDLGIVGAERRRDPDLQERANPTSSWGCLSHLKGFGVRTIAITGDTALGARAKLCDVALDAWVREEACPHDLAPTTSTTAALALGDALAVACSQEKGFRREDFARLHPGGALGRQLVVRVEEMMLTRRPARAALDVTPCARRSS